MEEKSTPEEIRASDQFIQQQDLPLVKELSQFATELTKLGELLRLAGQYPKGPAAFVKALQERERSKSRLHSFYQRRAANEKRQKKARAKMAKRTRKNQRRGKK